MQDSQGVEQLPVSEARRFSLPGPVLVKMVYVTHPADESTLVPFAEYDETVMRDKLNEALRVVNELRASRVVAKAVRGDSSGGHAAAAKGLGINFGGGKAAAWDVAYEQNGVGGPPRDPRPLLYPREPGLEAACVAVLNNGARDVRIEIVRQYQLTVEGDLAAGLKKVGFKLGVALDKSKHSVFVIEAKFEALPERPGRKDVPAQTAAARPEKSGWRRR